MPGMRSALLMLPVCALAASFDSHRFSASSAQLATQDTAASSATTGGHSTGPCWVEDELADCCPEGSVKISVETCDDGKLHSMWPSNKCKPSTIRAGLSKLNPFSDSKPKPGHRARCSSSPEAKEAAKAAAEAAEAAASKAKAAEVEAERKRMLADAQLQLQQPATMELCHKFDADPGLCAEVGCAFVLGHRAMFSVDKFRCNRGCCPSGKPRTGGVPGPMVCGQLASSPGLCAAAGCIHTASSKVLGLFGEGASCDDQATVAASGGGGGGTGGASDGAGGSSSGSAAGDSGDFEGEDVDLMSPNESPKRQERLEANLAKAEKAAGGVKANVNEGKGNMLDGVRDGFKSAIKHASAWIKEHQHGCRTGIFASMRGQVQPKTCGGCVGTTVGGLAGLFSDRLCGWCAVDGHSSNIGYCVGNVNLCRTMRSGNLNAEFGERVHFNGECDVTNRVRCIFGSMLLLVVGGSLP